MRRHSGYERIATSLLALLVAAIILPAGLAFLHDGIEMSAKVRIEASPDQVWEFIVQPAKRKSWHAGVVSLLPLRGDGVGKGSTSLLLYRDKGPNLELEEEILAWEPPTLWRVRQETEIFSSEIEITLSSSGTGRVAGSGTASLITYRETKRLRPFADRYLALWLRWKYQRRLSYSMARLKLLVERAVAEMPEEPQISPPTIQQ